MTAALVHPDTDRASSRRGAPDQLARRLRLSALGRQWAVGAQPRVVEPTGRASEAIRERHVGADSECLSRSVRQDEDVTAGGSEESTSPSLRRVVTVNQRLKSSEGGALIVTLVEVWNDALILRWVEAPKVMDSPHDLFRYCGATLEDDVGTAYEEGGSGGGGGRERTDMHARFRPSPPPEATELRISWPQGQRTTVPLV